MEETKAVEEETPGTPAIAIDPKEWQLCSNHGKEVFWRAKGQGYEWHKGDGVIRQAENWDECQAWLNG